MQRMDRNHGTTTSKADFLSRLWLEWQQPLRIEGHSRTKIDFIRYLMVQALMRSSLLNSIIKAECLGINSLKHHKMPANDMITLTEKVPEMTLSPPPYSLNPANNAFRVDMSNPSHRLMADMQKGRYVLQGMAVCNGELNKLSAQVSDERRR